MGGRAYGFLPSLERREGNAFLTRIIPTGLGEARNFAVVGASEALISVGDNEGTRIETNIALKAGKRVYGLLTDYRPDHELFEPVDSGRPSSHVVQLSVQAAEDWRARSHSPRSLDAVHDATEGSRPAETTAVSSQQRIESLWRSYDSAQRHYEKDLDLFVTRMNLFILVVAGFAALDRSKAMVDSGSAVAGLGLALSVCWLGLWGSSYYWILEWRDELVAIGRRIEGMTCVAPAALNRFGDTRARGRPKKALVNLSRPTGLTLALPLVFCIYWSAGLVQFL
ncbi:TIGR00725 family protein [Geodermatophilus pulveris]|uniref:TIGR00725 family protein n=2 Tax=Geodermatophilus pulveris TaxID=1564159 RepID=A0A239CQ13_9ACTN|nr:TIGR00725 family protein [Geodermatophilus pulveris]